MSFVLLQYMSIHANDTCIYAFVDVGNCTVSNES